MRKYVRSMRVEYASTCVQFHMRRDLYLLMYICITIELVLVLRISKFARERATGRVCYVTVTLLNRKLQLTYTLHVTLCLLERYFETNNNR